MSVSSSSSTNPLNWESVLNGHQIFDSSTGSSDDSDSRKADETSLELSITTLSKSKSTDATQDRDIPGGRRRVMLVKDADLIVAVGKQVRMMSLTESRLDTTGSRTFNVGVEVDRIYTRPSLIRAALDIMHTKPAIRNPRTGIKSEWAPSRRGGCFPGHSDRVTASRVHETRAANSRLQVRSRVNSRLTLVDEEWIDLYRSANSTMFLVLLRGSPRSIGTHGAKVVLLFW